MMEEDDIIVSGQSCSHRSHAALTHPPSFLYVTVHTSSRQSVSQSARWPTRRCQCFHDSLLALLLEFSSIQKTLKKTKHVNVCF